jgi:hypothetical protein
LAMLASASFRIMAIILPKCGLIENLWINRRIFLNQV